MVAPYQQTAYATNAPDDYWERRRKAEEAAGQTPNFGPNQVPTSSEFDPAIYQAALGRAGVAGLTPQTVRTEAGPFSYSQTQFTGSPSGDMYAPTPGLSPERFAEITRASMANAAGKPMYTGFDPNHMAPNSRAFAGPASTASRPAMATGGASPTSSGGGTASAQGFRYNMPSLPQTAAAASAGTGTGGGGSAYERILARIRSRRP